MKFAVLQFPGSNSDQDCVHTARLCGHEAGLRWHKDTSLGEADAVLVPGGFSYGDYLRSGAIARFSPIMAAVQEFASNGGLVLGICNGFQILCEAGLLPGAMIRNRSLQFLSEPVYLKTVTRSSPFTGAIPTDKLLRVPVAHGDGCYFADPETLAQMKANNQILWQYCDAEGHVTGEANPNGSVEHIAGVCNLQHNVAGLMPHPERASEPLTGGLTDGRLVFESMLQWLEKQSGKAAA